MLLPSSQELLESVCPSTISSPPRAQAHGGKSEEVNVPQKRCPMFSFCPLETEPSFFRLMSACPGCRAGGVVGIEGRDARQEGF